jgi:Alpha-kinase family
MITDLQGIYHESGGPEGSDGASRDRDRVKNTLLLTDPAIHCTQPRFGLTNLGEDGFRHFFEAHVCNRYCAALKLGRSSA